MYKNTMLTDRSYDSMYIRFFWRSSLAGVTALILYLSLVPSPPSDGLGWDKANHAVAMALVTFVAYRSAFPSPKALVFGGIYAASLGGLVEVLQGTLETGRSSEWYDLLADLFGVVTMLLVLMMCRRSSEPWRSSDGGTV